MFDVSDVTVRFGGVVALDGVSAQFTAPVTPFAVDHPLPSVETVAAALGLSPADIGVDGSVVERLRSRLLV